MGFETLGKKLAQLGADTKTSVKKMSDTYQMSGKIAEEKKNLEKLFAKIGEAAYDKFADNVPEGLEEVFEAVKTVKLNIQDLEEQKQKMSGSIVCPDCGKEAAKGEKFCSACGCKLPDEPVDETKEKVKQDMKEAAAEAGEIMNGAADKAKDLFASFAGKADAFVKGVSSKLNEKAAEGDIVDGVAKDVEEAADEAEAVADEAEGVMEEAENTEAAEAEAEAAMDEEVKKVQEAAQETIEE